MAYMMHRLHLSEGLPWWATNMFPGKLMSSMCPAVMWMPLDSILSHFHLRIVSLQLYSQSISLRFPSMLTYLYHLCTAFLTITVWVNQFDFNSCCTDLDCAVHVLCTLLDICAKISRFDAINLYFIIPENNNFLHKKNWKSEQLKTLKRNVKKICKSNVMWV